MDPQIHYDAGWSILAFSGLNILVNMSLMFYITFVSIKANLSVYCGKLKNFMQPKKLIEDELNVDPNATMRIPQSL